MIAVVLAGGRVVATPAIRAAVAGAEIVVAADGGARHARALGIEPQTIVGDLDSIDDATLRRHPDALVRRHPRDKDQLDLELALDEAAARGASKILVVGAFGGRIDHAAAVLAIAAARHRADRPIELHGGDALGLPVASGERRAVDQPPGTVVSVLAALPSTVVTLRGLRFPLDAAPLEMGSGRGVSNAVTAADASVEVHAGTALVVVPALGDVRAALVVWGRHAERIDGGLRALDAELGDLVRGVAYDRVFDDGRLDLRTRELLAIGQLVGLRASDDLRTHVLGALRAGASPEEIRATVRHAAMFVGFPAAVAAARVVREVLDPDERV